MIPEIEAQALQEKLDSNEPPLLVDVRQPQEQVTDGALQGAVLIPLAELPARLAELPVDREIVAYCRSGQRSFNAANWLRAQGREAFSLRGGINLWKSLGLPLKR